MEDIKKNRRLDSENNHTLVKKINSLWEKKSKIDQEIQSLSYQREAYLNKIYGAGFITSYPSFIKSGNHLGFISRSEHDLYNDLQKNVAHISGDELDDLFNEFSCIWESLFDGMIIADLSSIQNGDSDWFGDFPRLPEGFEKIDEKTVAITDIEKAKGFISNYLVNDFSTLLARFKVLTSTGNNRWVVNGKTYSDIDMLYVLALHMAGRSVVCRYVSNLRLEDLSNRYLLETYKILSVKGDYKVEAISIKDAASKGGKAKAEKRKGMKDHIISLYDEGRYKSVNNAAYLLVSEADKFASKNNVTPLAPSNAQRTIVSWISKHIKNTV